MTKSELVLLRKKIIERDFSNLNDMQKKAVFSTEGPLLVLAGAGSGKTTVLVNRIANIIKYGRAYYSEEFPENISAYETAMLTAAASGADVNEDIKYLLSEQPAKPWQILAITFTNKAANELKNRLLNIVGPEAEDIWASTFHAACVRILRRNAAYIGFPSSFTIYDTDDSKRVIKDCLKQLQLNDKIITAKYIISEISKAKNSLITPEEYGEINSYDFMKKNIAEIYALYQQKLREAGAMDFDDIICHTVNLLKNVPDVLEYYQHKFRYILVDEYQDTNHMQYELISLLAAQHKNICVVGDDDQSIYKFRGATIENILSFESEYSDSKVIRLEQNYRSTQTILDAANAVIANNSQRKGKNLWSAKQGGSKIVCHYCEEDREEGYFVADNILKEMNKGKNYSDFAVLYRMNSQSNLIEQAFVRNAIPYRIIGGHKFYDRKEIKDAIAYLQVISNPNDTVRLGRIINEPKRGIGESSFNRIIQISSDLGLPVLEVMKSADEYPLLSRSAKSIMKFADDIEGYREYSENHKIEDLLRMVLNESGYLISLNSEPDRVQDRLENLDQLLNNIKAFEDANEDGGLTDFLEEIALMTDIDEYNSESDSVVMMTVHSAKGLEFDTVFLIGMEENIFPSEMSAQEGESGIEEERRLAYVAITRAKEKLFISSSRSRMLFGMTRFNPVSRFVNEIPGDLTVPSDENAEQEKLRTARRKTVSHSSKSESSASKGRDYGFSGLSASKPKSSVTYKVGDTVIHKTYGEGVILSVTPMSNDSMLEIAFLKGVTKKIMANYAKMEKK